MDVKSILLPIDNSLPSARSFHTGLQLAKSLGASVKIMHIVDSSAGFILDGESALAYANMLSSLRNDGHALLNRVEAVAKEAGVPCVAVLKEGAPADEITNEAKEHDLVVMGSHSYRGFSKWLLGSVAESVLHNVKTPTICLRRQEGDKHNLTYEHVKLNSILVAYDGSEYAKYAWEQVLPLAKKCGAKVHLVHVVANSMAVFLGTMDMPEIDREKLIARETAAAEEILEQAAAKGKDEGITVTSEVIRTDDHAADVLVKQCHGAAYDLVVMGTRGRRGMRRLFMVGSVTEGVLRQTDVPVLALHKPE